MPVGLKLIFSSVISSAFLPPIHYIPLLALIKLSFAKK